MKKIISSVLFSISFGLTCYADPSTFTDFSSSKNNITGSSHAHSDTSASENDANAAYAQDYINELSHTGTTGQTPTAQSKDANGTNLNCAPGESKSTGSVNSENYQSCSTESKTTGQTLGTVQGDPGAAGKLPAGDCADSIAKVIKTCQGDKGIAAIASTGTTVLTGYSAGKGDILGACNAMSTALDSQIAINSAFAVICQRAVASCHSSCRIALDPAFSGSYAEANKVCSGFEETYQNAFAQAAASAIGYTKVAQCKAQARANDCSLSANANLPQCKSSTNNTLSPGTLPEAGTKTAGSELPPLPDAVATTPNAPGAASPAAAGNNQGGYTSGLGGPSAAAAGKPGGSDPKNPEVFMGTGNGSAGIDSMGSNAYDASLLRNGNGDASMKAFDLSKYMPGKKAGLRAPASVDANALLKSGISAANGLSNWEKITKKMHEKQPELRK